MKRLSQFGPWARRVLCWGALTSILAGCANFGGRLSEEGDVQIRGDEEASQKVSENLSKPYVSPLGDIPLDETALTQQWIKYWQGRGRKHMEIYLQRSARYLPMMKNTLREYGLPENLVYVSLIESGFSPAAHSHANAVGYWQFIRSTGKRYGLQLDAFIDERRDPVLSTRAAAEYFKALYNLFGSWHLSLAAYNAGENRVKRAVMKYYTRDFWQLTKHRRSLAKETKHYVPKFIAATLIATNPEKYGFTNVDYQQPLEFETVKLTNPVSMTKLAQSMSVDVEDLKMLNPKFRGDFVPMYRGNDTVIRVPVGQTERAVAAIPQSIVDQPKVAHTDYYFYRVRRGDTLSGIAKKHRTSIATLRRLNRLGSRSLLRIGQRLRVPDRGGAYVSYTMSSGSAPSTPDRQVQSVKKTIHVVRRGENLSLIARKYGLSVGDLLRENKLSHRSVLRVGQKLKIRNSESADQASPGEVRRAKTRRVASVKKKVIKHRVRRGETLLEIAQKYRVSVRKIARKNSIRNKSMLLAGSELVIPLR